MASPSELLGAVMESVARLRAVLRRQKGPQVRSHDERALIKATAFEWFQKVRPALPDGADGPLLAAADEGFQFLLESAERNTTRARYLTQLASLHELLTRLR